MTRPAEDEVLLRLARGVVGISTRAAERLGGVSIVQLRALTVLRSLHETNLGRLAEGMGVTVSTTSRLVDRLVAAGLVERRPSPHSRRELSLTVSPAGRALLDRYDDLRLAELRAGLAALSGTERDDVLAALSSFASALPGAVAPVASR